MTSMGWNASIDRDAYKGDFLAAIDAVADAARDGRWRDMCDALGSPRLHELAGPNLWRIGGRSCYTPLHQAAWHGAPAEVAEELLRRGAWRTLRAVHGQTAADIARTRGHEHLVPLLEPPAVEREFSFFVIDGHLMGLIEARIRPSLTLRLRYPQTSVVHETGRALWYPVPGMYGGFAIEPTPTGVEVTSWSRVAGGSGQRHRIDKGGCHLVEEGFV